MSEFQSNLWAPWRMEYIRSMADEVQETGCFLCRYFENPDQDAQNHVIWRTDLALVMMNRFPYTNGHLMVALHRHCGEPTELTEKEQTELATLSFRATGLLRRVVRAEGFNVGINVGRCAGAGVPDHLHSHIVPRWSGDTNYMAVLGGVRVIPDGLDALYDELVKTAREMGLRQD